MPRDRSAPRHGCFRPTTLAKARVRRHVRKQEMFDAAALARLNALTDLRLAVSRLPRGLSPVAGAALGIATYQLEKKLMHPVHPRFGRALGFRSEFVAVKSLSGAQALHDALIAS